MPSGDAVVRKNVNDKPLHGCSDQFLSVIGQLGKKKNEFSHSFDLAITDGIVA